MDIGKYSNGSEVDIKLGYMHTVAPPCYGAGQFCEDLWFNLTDAVRFEELYVHINIIVIETVAFYKRSIQQEFCRMLPRYDCATLRSPDVPIVAVRST